LHGFTPLELAAGAARNGAHAKLLTSMRYSVLHRDRATSKGELMPVQMIVLVEDNPDDQTLTLRALKKQNLANEIIVLNDGVEALEYLLDPEKPLPHLLLLDLKLPKLDGLQLLRRLRSEPRTQLLPVVVLTSSDEDRDVIEGYRLGANSYIRKPVDFNQFSEAVRQLGLYWLVLNQSPPRP
jgi:two-component system response regulator